MPRSTISTFDPSNIGPDTPLRLDNAARLAFPDGSIGASGLRRERDRGHLVIEKIAGKEFTTLRNIEEMRKQCRAKQEGHTSTLGKTGQTAEQPHGSSVTGLTDAERIAARDSALMRLSKTKTQPLPNILPANTTPGPKADVIPMKR
jgi:hypothetical protein